MQLQNKKAFIILEDKNSIPYVSHNLLEKAIIDFFSKNIEDNEDINTSNKFLEENIKILIGQ
jgi:hypothetical protein